MSPRQNQTIDVVKAWAFPVLLSVTIAMGKWMHADIQEQQATTLRKMGEVLEKVQQIQLDVAVITANATNDRQRLDKVEADISKLITACTARPDHTATDFNF